MLQWLLNLKLWRAKTSLRSSNTSDPRHELGRIGEELTVAHLKKEGFSILAQNFRRRSGEVDVIAQKDSVLAFVEVKMRSHEYFNLSQIITPAKQRKIISAAKAFIMQHQIHNTIFRFDAALITYNNTRPHLMYIPNAFTQAETEDV